MENRALLNMQDMTLHFAGPGEVQVILPPGSESFQLEMSPSGHLMLPCCEYTTDKSTELRPEAQLTLAAETAASSDQ